MIFSRRTRTSVVSSVSCLSAVESDGNDEAMKSTKPARLFDVHGHRRKLIGQSRRTGDDLLEQSQHVALQRFDLGILRRNGLRNRDHLRAHERRELGEVGEAHALQALGKNKEALVGHLDDFVDDRQRPYRIQVGGLRRIDARLALRHHHDGLVVAERVDQLN